MITKPSPLRVTPRNWSRTSRTSRLWRVSCTWRWCWTCSGGLVDVRADRSAEGGLGGRCVRNVGLTTTPWRRLDDVVPEPVGTGLMPKYSTARQCSTAWRFLSTTGCVAQSSPPPAHPSCSRRGSSSTGGSDRRGWDRSKVGGGRRLYHDGKFGSDIGDLFEFQNCADHDLL